MNKYIAPPLKKLIWWIILGLGIVLAFVGVAFASATIDSLTSNNFGDTVEAGAIIEKSWFEVVGNIMSGFDSTPDGWLSVDTNGNIGADQYCDQNGNNCADGKLATETWSNSMFYNRAWIKNNLSANISDFDDIFTYKRGSIFEKDQIIWCPSGYPQIISCNAVDDQARANIYSIDPDWSSCISDGACDTSGMRTNLWGDGLYTELVRNSGGKWGCLAYDDNHDRVPTRLDIVCAKNKFLS